MEFIKKDITTVVRGVVAHGCNCKGVMGSGVALAVRKKWPMAFTEYVRLEPSPTLLGKAQVVPVSNSVWVVNCFTQESYGRNPNTKYANAQAIEKSLSRAFELAYQEEIPLYMPPIGCGLGGLDWGTEVEPIVRKLVDKYEIDTYICDI